MLNFGNYQNEIYFAGLSGVVPSLPMRFEELEARAHEAMPASVASYVAAGCGDERTQDANVAASQNGGWCRACSSGRQSAISRSSSSA
jgi:lactate 2-monooxygenase